MSGFIDRTIPELAASVTDRRALEELIADWRHESVRARGAIEHLVVAVRWSAALVGAVGRIATREAGSAVAWRPIVGAVLLASVFTLASFLWAPPRSLDRLYGTLLPMLLLPQGIAAFLGPTLAVVLSRADRVALLGTTMATAVVVTALVGWIVPESNQTFRQQLYDQARRSSAPDVVPRGAGELTAVQLFRGTAQTPFPDAVRRQLSRRGALIAWALAGIALGDQLRRRTAGWRRWTVTAVALAMVVSALGGSVLTSALIEALVAVRVGELHLWIIVSWFWLVALAWAAGGRRSAPLQH
jgi:hypothetical protein